jgi:hypothetical protein
MSRAKRKPLSNAASLKAKPAKRKTAKRKSFAKRYKLREGLPVGAYSIPEFCRAHGISVDTYFQMQRDKVGPDTMGAGARTLISVEAAARWRAAREEAARRKREAKAAAKAENAAEAASAEA